MPKKLSTWQKVSLIALPLLCVALFPLVRKMFQKPPSVIPPAKPKLILSDVEKALSQVEMTDLSSLIYQNYLAVQKYYLQADEQTLRTLTTLVLFKQSYIAEGCYPYVTWERSRDRCYNSLKILLKNGESLFRHDAVNDQHHQGDFLSFKRALLELSDHDLSQIIDVCLSNQDTQLDDHLYQIITELYSLSFALFGRYPISTQEPFLSIEKVLYASLEPLILKELIHSHDIEALYDLNVSKELCKQLIVSLLSTARVSGTSLHLFHHQLDFSPKADCELLNLSEFKWIAPLTPNPLSSTNYLDDPVITNEPILIAKFLQEFPDQDLENCPDFAPFARWIEKEYYYPFCAAFLKQLDTLTRPKSVTPELISSRRSSIKNDLDGSHYRLFIEKEFHISDPWIFPGNCFLVALFPELENQLSLRCSTILDKRKEIAEYIKKNASTYVNYVEVITDFNDLTTDKKLSLQLLHWAIAEDNTLSSKLKAIHSRCERMIQDVSAELMEPEYAVTSEILQAPIYIYKQNAATFTLHEDKHVKPSVIYGENLPGAPHYLLDTFNHFQILKPKKTGSFFL
ncbi:MAG: hypothetical protein QRY71_03455 [Candidatus Rhabdochlamydia sp.]